MKKILIVSSIAAVPFLLVWAAFILTGFNFSPSDVFNSGTFWGFSTMYWFLYICTLPLIIESVYEINTTKKNTIPQSFTKEDAMNKLPSDYYKK